MSLQESDITLLHGVIKTIDERCDLKRYGFVLAIDVVYGSYDML